MKLTNIKMNLYLNFLKSISTKVTGKLGYAVAKNMRKIANELVEFENIKNEYICKHGKKNKNGTFSIDNGSEEYRAFLDYIEEFVNIEHEVDIFKINEEELSKSDLTAEEMLNLEFMIKNNEETATE